MACWECLMISLELPTRKEGETDEVFLQRERTTANAFDAKLLKMGITKQTKKDSPTKRITVWLGFLLDTRDQTLAITSQKEMVVVFEI